MISFRFISFLALSLLLLSQTLAQADESSSTEEEEAERTGTIIGIDLGTTYSCVGVFQAGKVEIIANDQGNRITPSYVAFSGPSDRLVGDAAKNQATINPENTIFDVKRLIGRQFSDDSVQADKALMPFDIVHDADDDKPYVQVKQGNTVARYAPEEISAMILQKLKVQAETFLGREVNRAVVTVPAYFNDAQRHATKDAGVIAGLYVERIINEPTAAAIAYGMEKLDGDESNVLVFDLGGGTFDVTVLSIDQGVFQVLATNGDTHLGGSDFDQSVMKYYIETIKSRSGRDIQKDKRALQKLRKEVERVKRALSSQFQANLDIEDLVSGYDFSETLTRAKFEELNADLFKKTLGPVKNVMEDAMLELDEIDEIILVGGSTRIPKVQQLIADFFKGKEPFHGVNPDEAVAHGAAIQGSILSGEGGKAVEDVMLLDVTPLSLGTSVEGGLMSVIIKRGTTIPTEKSEEYFTLEPNQNRMTIDVYEGERSRIKHNHLLGEFELTGIPPGPRGAMRAVVTFRIDTNGILEVTAEGKWDKKGTNNKKTITITPESGRLSQDDIDRMVQEAEKYADEDKKARQRIESRNQLESYAYSLKATVDENEDKIPKDANLQEFLDAIDETLDWLDSHQDSEKDEFDNKYSELKSLSQPVMSVLYTSTDGEEEEPSHGGDDEL